MLPVIVNTRLAFCCRVWVVVAGLVPAAPAAESLKPNIVLILADDLGINDLGCYGRRDHRTPHLDRLAAEGVRFTAAYAPAPLCSASRAALLTGKHPARLHLTSYLPGRANSPTQKLLQPRQEGQLPLEEVTLAEALQSAGYATACLGKWHLGGAGFGPKAQGFQTAEPGEPNTTPSDSEGSKGTIGLAAKAETFIAAHRDQPFFLYLAHDSPHIPFSATEDATRRHADLGNTFNAAYGAEVEWLDRSVGRVLAALDAHRITDRTLVIFTSDNGGLHVPELGLPPPTHNTPHRAGKGFLFEGGIRVPLIVRWPGTAPTGAVPSVPVVLTDMMPTLMEVAGLDPGKASGPLDGISLRPWLRPEPPPAVDAARPIFWHFPHYSNQGGRPSGALRDGRWKLVEDFALNQAFLFDLESDPGESRDLSAAEPTVTAALRDRLAIWRQGVGAAMPSENPEYSEDAAAPLFRHTDVSRSLEGKWTPDHPWKAWRLAMDAAVAGRKTWVTPAQGDVRLAASQARAYGAKLRYEPEPWKNTLGYWVEADDWAKWDLTVPADGRYEVEVLQGCGQGNGGSEVEITIGEKSLRWNVRETGHFQQFIPLTIGEVDLKAGPHTLAIRCLRKARNAVVDVRRVVVRPVAGRPRD
ncbi:MAG: sulfatase-like hydrolase/transferase [Verrucomicrobiales bacterium]